MVLSSYLHGEGEGTLSNGEESNVVPIRKDFVDTESKLLVHFNRVRSELTTIDTIEDALRVRDGAELLRVLATKIKATKETLDEIAILKVRSERKLGQLIGSLPETRGGDHKSKEFQNQRSSSSTFDKERPTLQNLGISRNLSSRSQLIAKIPDELFEEKIIYTTKQLNRGRDLSSELWSYAKYLKRKQERQQRREEASVRAEEIEPDEKIKVIHGDFREVLPEVVPEGSVSLVATDPPYIKKDGTNKDLWISLSEFSSRTLLPGKVLVSYAGKYALDQCMEALGTHLQYVWAAAITYPSFPDTMHHWRIKTYFKLALIYSKEEYEPLMTRFWFKDLINGDGYKGLKDYHRWGQGLQEAQHLVESLTEEGDLVVDPFMGAGTFAIACKKLNRRFVGCDIDKEAINTTLFRLSQEESHERGV